MMRKLLRIVLGMLVPLVAWGQTPAGEEMRINAAAAGVRHAPAVATLADGDFIVVWESEAPAGIRGRRVAGDGSPVGEELAINTTTSGGEKAASVASAAAAGGFVVVWESAGSRGTDSSMTSVQARRFRAGGEPAGSQFQVNAYTTNRQEHPRVAMAADGDFVVVWASYGSYGDDRSQASIQGQRFGSDGARLGQQFQVNTFTGGPQDRPAVAMDAGGGFVVVWGGTSQGRRFASDGTALGDELFFHAGAPGRSFFDPAVAMAPGGEFVVAWQDTYFGLFGARYLSILTRAYSPDGEPLDFGPIELHEDFSVSRVPDLAPALAVPAAGEMVVVWGHNYYESIAGGRYTTLGQPLGDFEAGASPGAHDPAVAADAIGRFLVVWSQDAGSDVEIRGRRLEYPVAGRACRDSATALCLRDDRFTVEVTWRDFQGAAGSARVVRTQSDDSGLFWFFDADNWEMLVKVLDGCAINGRYWVFAAATTNVEYTLRVTDESRGVDREYVNPLGRASPAVTDTSAFATCPLEGSSRQ